MVTDKKNLHFILKVCQKAVPSPIVPGQKSGQTEVQHCGFICHPNLLHRIMLRIKHGRQSMLPYVQLLHALRQNILVEPVFPPSLIWRHLKIYIKPSLILSLTCISIYYYRIMKKLCHSFQLLFLDQLSIPGSENLYISFPEFRVCCKLALLTVNPLSPMTYSFFMQILAIQRRQTS